MKEIELPSVPKFMVSMNKETMVPEPSHVQDGTPWFSFGKIDFGQTNELLSIVKSNGAKILYATTWLESRLEEILMQFFMGEDEFTSERSYLFKHEVLESSGFSFSFKKETCIKIINHLNLLKGKNKDKLPKLLKNIMSWRNAFAHGTLGYDGAKGCFIDFYQGGQQRLLLDDEFWVECESTFTSAHECIDQVLKQLKQST
ncbi:hypothetical protein [Aliagarivorans marinus]|uniref:hypothetical protein n=1 Tax=Aliagarivorans marinus TaxID=561965 RepID=UPI0006848C9A|nr:hypothetical protein [Aliagarivorans marinus]